jgi:hypothetical protein
MRWAVQRRLDNPREPLGAGGAPALPLLGTRTPCWRLAARDPRNREVGADPSVGVAVINAAAGQGGQNRCGAALLAAAAVVLGMTLSLTPVRADPQEGTAQTDKESTRGGELCGTLAQAARDNQLPLAFFTRLIWQESRFNPTAISPKGALGIAQFMPHTAAVRGLANPLEPLLALRESASYLRELRTTFGGNLGLAAAAYNAGPGRIEAWLAGRRALPRETRAYVRLVTGHSAESWASQQPPQWQDGDVGNGQTCAQVARAVLIPSAPQPRVNPAWGPWGVQLAGNWSEGQLLARYEQLRRKYATVLRDRLPLVLRASLPGRSGAVKYVVRVSENSRTGADALCAALRAVGGACAVLRNPPG